MYIGARVRKLFKPEKYPQQMKKKKKKIIQKVLIRKTITQFRKEAHTLCCMLNCKEREIKMLNVRSMEYGVWRIPVHT